MLLTKKVIVKPYGKMIKYYREKGYQANYGEPLEINIEDLPESSHVKVQGICDYDGEPFERPWCEYIASRKIVEKDCCHNKSCHVKKAEDCNLKKYGVKSSWERPEIQKKKKETLMEHYGTDSPLKVPEIYQKTLATVKERYNVNSVQAIPGVREKREATMFKKYGAINTRYVPEIEEKIKKTNIKKYGGSSPFCSKEVREKAKETLMEKYDVDNPFFIPGVWEKVHQKTRSAIYSSPQKKLAELYNGELNYPIDNYFIDIFFDREKICLEYDGTGHDLSVRRGNISKKDFQRKEVIRYKTLKRNGYKQARIVKTKNDKLPPKNILLQIKEIMFDFLLSEKEKHYYIYFLIDEQKIVTPIGEYNWDYKSDFDKTLLLEDNIRT